MSKLDSHVIVSNALLIRADRVVKARAHLAILVHMLLLRPAVMPPYNQTSRCAWQCICFAMLADDPCQATC